MGFHWLWIVAVSLSLSSTLLQAQEVGQVSRNPSGTRTLPDAIIVEFQARPTSAGVSMAAVRQQRTVFLAGMVREGIQSTIRHSFGSLMNGVSLQLANPDDASRIAALPSVKAVYPVQIRSLPEEPRSSVNVAAAIAQGINLKPEHDMTNVTEVHNMGITGKGIKVGIIDTGIDYTHPAFGACTKIGPPCRVAYGYDFVGNDYNADSTNKTQSTPHPGGTPLDCNGHGTHVSGIAGGNDTFWVGVAPTVTLGAYRVFGCEGSSADDVIMAAMERAFEDGMDVINLSLGGSPVWPEDPLAMMATKLQEQGLLVFSAMGNSGDTGLWDGESPGVSSLGFGVASFDNEYLVNRVFQVTPGGYNVSYSMNPGQYQYLKDGYLAVSSNDTTTLVDGCSPYVSTPFAGKIVLIRRGTCTFAAKAINAQAAGAIGVIVYNRVPEPLALSAEDPKLFIPVAGISDTDGVALINLTKTGPVLITWLPDTEQEIVPIPTAGQISGFSTWGLSPDLSIKPDIGAPGGSIFSSFPVAQGSYAVLSGTSMATPYAAGVAALSLSAKQPRPETSGAKTAFQNSAVPAVLQGYTVKASVASQGAGMVNALNLIQNSVVWEAPSNLSLGFLPADMNSVTVSIRVFNSGQRTVVYRLSHTPSATVDATQLYSIAYVAKTAVATFLPDRLVIPPNGFAISLLTLETIPAAAGELLIYSGYLKMEPDLLGQQPDPNYGIISEPYAALKGDPLAYQIQAKSDSNGKILPQMTDVYGGVYTSPNSSATFTFNGTSKDVPTFSFQTQRPASLIALKLYTFSSDSFLGYISYAQYIGVTGPANLYQVSWAPPGFIPSVLAAPASNPNSWTPIPDGEYYAVAESYAPAEILGGPEMWRSPRIVVKTK